MSRILDNKVVSGFTLGAFLVLAMALRAWGADVGLPNDFVPDEESKITAIFQFETTYFRHWESQPSFTYYSLYALFKIAEPMRDTIIHATHLEHRFTGPNADFAFAKWIGRLYMGFLGTLTCFFLYRLGKVIAGKPTGLVAAYLYAVSPIPIALCHYIKEDTPLVLFTTMNLVCCMKVITKGRMKDYFYAGLTAGLAFASKYPGIVTLAILAGAICIRERDAFTRIGSWGGSMLHVLKLMRLPLAIFVFTFFCICFTYLDVVRLVEGLAFQAKYMVTGHHDGLGITPLQSWFLFYIKRSLIPGLTLPVFLLSLPGIYFLWKHSRKLAIIPLVWGLGYLFIAECLPAKPYPFFSRYIIPVFPMFCIYAAMTLGSLPEVLARFIPRLIAVAVVQVGGAIIAATPLCFSVLFLRSAAPDTREQAMEWVAKNVPPGSLIWETTARYTGYFDETKYEVDELKRSGFEDKRAAYAERPVYGVVSGFAVDRYLENKDTKPRDYKFWHDRIMGKGVLLADFTAPGPTYGYHNPWVKVYMLPPAIAGEKED